MNFFSSLFARILSFPKSLYVSIRLCGFRLGFKVPVRIHYSTKLGALTGRILLIGENKCLLYIARKSDFPYDHKHCRWKVPFYFTGMPTLVQEAKCLF